MTKLPKYSHLFPNDSQGRFNEYKKAVCGARTKNMFAAHLKDAAKFAEFLETREWIPRLCPKCAAVALLAEVTEANRV